MHGELVSTNPRVRDVHSQQFEVLLHLAEYGEGRTMDIGNHLGISPSSIQAALEKLLRKGLVNMRKETDKRVIGRKGVNHRWTVRTGTIRLWQVSARGEQFLAAIGRTIRDSVDIGQD